METVDPVRAFVPSDRVIQVEVSRMYSGALVAKLGEPAVFPAD
jgi:hypothetical protein